YVGETGDLVVGRITAVESKRWKCDISGQKDAVLHLASVNLPGGVQRMRTYEDQLQMRSLYMENDLISAEVQNINSDGTPSLHTRSLKYGKLENGQVMTVPSSLIRRLPQHYVTLPWGVDVLLGRNGFIWISRCIPEEWKAQEAGMDE
ncbi:EXOSC2, partial [Symbiodinium microadriaticum]